MGRAVIYSLPWRGDGCSSHTIEARTVHEVVLADILKHAGQALTDRKAMVTEMQSVLIFNCQRIGNSRKRN